MSHLHLQLPGGDSLQLGGNGALQSVSNQSQTLTAVVGNSQDLALHRLPVHPVTLEEAETGGKEQKGRWRGKTAKGKEGAREETWEVNSLQKGGGQRIQFSNMTSSYYWGQRSVRPDSLTNVSSRNKTEKHTKMQTKTPKSLFMIFHKYFTLNLFTLRSGLFTAYRKDENKSESQLDQLKLMDRSMIFFFPARE